MTPAVPADASGGKDAVGDTIVKEIVVRASAERVFSALADPAQRVKWWGAPGKFEVEHMESELKPGGAWQMRGKSMGTRPFVIRGVYRAVQPPRLLEFTWQPDWPEPETLVRFELEEKAGSTTVRLTHSGLSREQLAMYQGWPWLLAMLQAYVEKQSEPITENSRL